MAVLDKERALAVNAFFSDGKKEVLGVHVLVNQMKPPLLRSHALALAPFDKARILHLVRASPYLTAQRNICIPLTVCSPFSLATFAKGSWHSSIWISRR
jgi:hypothetical protein